MAAVIIAEAVEEAVETAVEGAVEEAVENAVENAVEEAVEDAVEEAVEQTVEGVVENAVEEAVETAVEDAVEDEVVGAIENAVGNVVSRSIIVDIVGLIVKILAICSIIDLIKAGTGVGKKKSDIDDKTRKKINQLEGVLDALSTLLKPWTDQLKTFNEKDSLGTVTYKNSRSADAGGVVWSLFNDTKEDLEKAQRLIDQCKDSFTWKANIDRIKLYVLQAAENVNAIFLTKDNAPIMKQKNFPPESDRQKMNCAFNKYYNHEWKMTIRMNAKKNLTKAIQHGAKKASETAVKNLIKKPLSIGIKTGIQKDVAPGAKKEAKSAAEAETTVVFNDWNARINLHAAIPVYGLATLKSWMMKNIKPEAVRKSTEKAKEAVNAVMELPDSQIKIMQITSEKKDLVLRQYKDQINQCADQAAKDYIKKAIAEHKGKGI